MVLLKLMSKVEAIWNMSESNEKTEYATEISLLRMVTYLEMFLKNLARKVVSQLIRQRD
jgi:hypothetical protein